MTKIGSMRQAAMYGTVGKLEKERERRARCFIGYHRTKPPPTNVPSLRRETTRFPLTPTSASSTHPFPFLLSLPSSFSFHHLYFPLSLSFTQSYHNLPPFLLLLSSFDWSPRYTGCRVANRAFPNGKQGRIILFADRFVVHVVVHLRSRWSSF